MDFAPTPEWQPVEREAFRAWLKRFCCPAQPLGMAGGYLQHPVPYYLDGRDGGLWCVEVQRNQVRLQNRSMPGYQFHVQAGWLLAFCWELKKPDAFRTVTVADCLQALERVP